MAAVAIVVLGRRSCLLSTDEAPPRRCYDAQGREVAPETVGGLLAAGIRRAEIWCNACHHHAEVAIERFPVETPVPDLCLRFRCSRCGGLNLSSRPSVMSGKCRVKAFVETLLHSGQVSDDVPHPLELGLIRLTELKP